MVAIPPYGDPTIEAMKRKMEQKTREKRDYLGASLIGNPCARQIWYEYNGFYKEPFDADTLMNFEDGHRTEDLTAERLRLVDGVTLITHGADGKQLGFTDLDGKFQGHLDGIITGLYQAPKTPHVWEGKACAEKKFRELELCIEKHGEKDALEHWNENYYAQHQLYMHYNGLTRGYMTVAKAGGRGYITVRTEYKEEVALKYIDRAEKIINAKNPPPMISQKKDFFICRWCSFKDTCKG